MMNCGKSMDIYFIWSSRFLYNVKRN